MSVRTSFELVLIARGHWIRITIDARDPAEALDVAVRALGPATLFCAGRPDSEG